MSDSKSRAAASTPEEILRFWLGPATSAVSATTWRRWFVPDPEFDRLCRTRFLATYEDATHGRMDDWKLAPRSCFALVLLLDQLPRNMFRDTAQAFATDVEACRLTRHAIASGFDRQLSPIMRMFLHLPLEHSENLNDQLESVALNNALAAENPLYASAVQSAEHHLEIIRRFGRFPWRNHALGRQSTKEELEFLKQRHDE